MTNEYRRWFGDKRGRLAAEAFREKGWTAHFANDVDEARRILFEHVLPHDVSVGLGGSETLAAMNVLPELRSGPYKLYDRYKSGVDHFVVCRDSLMADYFLTGANALTMNGIMVNIDCSGSRVAAMAYGPQHIVVAAGVNKLVDTLDQAIERVHSVAPMNCKRNNHKTPCVETGLCADCNDHSRMCNHLLITYNAQKFPDRFTIILINDDIGF